MTPSFKNILAAQNPIPEVDPLINTVFPFSCKSILNYHFFDPNNFSPKLDNLALEYFV